MIAAPLEPASESPSSVAVIIPTFNHACYLADAIQSSLNQSTTPAEIIVVDDGSTDDPAAVVAQFPGVRIIHQSNQGLSAARNTGLLAASNSRFAVFLDADDVLHGDALRLGLACFETHSESGFVYGAHRRVDERLQPLGETKYTPVDLAHPHLDFLRGNPIGMHATVLYDRAKLAESGGFNVSLRRCEDYDVYLRLSRRYPVASHCGLVADYRWHDYNMSSNPAEMLDWVLKTQGAYRPDDSDDSDETRMRAWRAGRAIWREYYSLEAWHLASRQPSRLKRLWKKGLAIKMAPAQMVQQISRRAARNVLKFTPAPVAYYLKKMFGLSPRPPVGHVHFGDFRRTEPISPDFGFDRGTPVDRYYVESFLASNSALIRGRALEIGDASYCRQFGSGIEQQDVLHVSSDNPQATIVGDLSQPGLLPEKAFDCQVITQTLHLIYDMKSAISELHRALRPGGVLLLTVPGITSIDRGDWGNTWYWSLTQVSAQRLFGEIFGDGNVTVRASGNVYSAVCFLHGLALEEVDGRKLDTQDASYPVIISVRACKVT